MDLVTVCWGHDTADGVRDMARLKHRLRARLNSTSAGPSRHRRRITRDANAERSAGNHPGRVVGEINSGEDSGEDSWLGRWGHLATKADVRVVTVPPPPHPAGVALAAAIAGEPLARQPPDAVEALAQCLGDETMFVLAVECAPITGPDLPALLPASARVPPPARCLETLNADVVDALADGGERALTWALKRCVRAAFERETLSTTDDLRRGRRYVGGRYGRSRTRTVAARSAACTRGTCTTAPDWRRTPGRSSGKDLAAALCASVHGPARFGARSGTRAAARCACD